MATLLELQGLVSDILDDDRYTSTDHKDFLNRGVNEIAGGMLSSLGDWITPPLPNLFKIDTVSTATDAAYVAMPVTFQRSMNFAANENGVEIDIANSFIEFSETYPLLDRSGIVTEVAEFGGNFYYQAIPTTSKDITLHFFRLPVAMAIDADIPDGIPLHLQIPLLVNFAVYKIYELIEDGFESLVGPNTKRYKSLFMEALKRLEATIPYDNRSMFLGD